MDVKTILQHFGTNESENEATLVYKSGMKLTSNFRMHFTYGTVTNVRGQLQA